MPAPFRSSRLVAALLAAGLAAGCGEAPAPAGPGAVPATVPAAVPSAASPDAEKDVVTAAYDRGLDYLASLHKDGVWEAQPGVPHAGFTALAIAPFLGRPGGLREKDRSLATKSVDFLASQVDQDGMVKGAQAPNYTISVVVMALAASGRADVKPVIDRCALALRKFQFLDENNTTFGGLGYGSDKTRSDLSNTQFALASLRAAGVPPEDPAFQRALKFLTRTQNLKENEAAGEPSEWKDADGKVYVRANDGGSNYRPGDSKAGFDERPDGVRVLRSYGSMTYALLRCYHLAGLPASDPRVQAAVSWISKHWALDRNPGMPANMQSAALYYMYATMGKTLPLAGIDVVDAGGAAVEWRRALAARLAAAQKPDGSWINDGDSKWEEGNPVVATSYALTALASCKH